jgi:lactoylglutathione lyase
MKLNLLVLRTPKIEDMLAFYSALGAHFQSERHGSGQEHYAATLGDELVLELYQTRDGAVPDSGLRLGLKVEDIAEALRSLGQITAPRQARWGLRACTRSRRKDSRVATKSARADPPLGRDSFLYAGSAPIGQYRRVQVSTIIS